MTSHSPADLLLGIADRALRTIGGAPVAIRRYPAQQLLDSSLASDLSETQRAESAALMRVNHVGEVCAQALYESQALGARDGHVRAQFQHAAAEEIDHLAWTQRRIDELGGRTSLLNPLWYGGAFAIGLVAARFGDNVSLGFMAETERQVEAHLASHLDRLPTDDAASRAVVEQMKTDEANHASSADSLGATPLPLPARWAMRLAAKVMTTTAHYI